MTKVIYDFREGLEREKIVYKKKKRNSVHDCYYVLYLLGTWAWTVAWFSLFLYAYTQHEFTAFWIYIAFWLAFVISFIIIAVLNIVNSRKKKEISVEQPVIVQEVIVEPQPVVMINGDRVNTNERAEFINN
jgi:magnesium-transporting ATPase (P-type)